MSTTIHIAPLEKRSFFNSSSLFFPGAQSNPVEETPASRREQFIQICVSCGLNAEQLEKLLAPAREWSAR